MKETKKQYMRSLLWAVAAIIAVPYVFGMGMSNKATTAPSASADDSIADYDEYRQQLPGTHPIGTLKPDTTFSERDMYVYIKAIARAYGDSVVLRWAVPSYPEWEYLNRFGYDVYRLDDDAPGFNLDTLARRIRPVSLEKFRKCYPDTIDSIAYLAMGSVYGSGDMTPEMTTYEPGSIGAFTEMAQDQKTRLMAAYLASEWRPDLAQALGLRFVDRNPKKGKVYSYFIAPSVTDTTGQFLIMPAQVEHVKNEKYKPQPYDIQITDSLLGHGSVNLSWNDTINGTFEIFMRPAGTSEWKKVNERPYAPPIFSSFNNEEVFFEHTHGLTGDFEYAIQAHDAFGDLTPMSKPVRVHFPDMQPPRGPEITKIEIERPGKNLWDKIYATIHFHKDTIEDDFVRYIPMYHNDRDSLKQWRLLSDQYISPADTVVRIDVSDISTGMIVMAAVDTAENIGYSFPRLLRIRDTKPPKAPTDFKAFPALDGTIALMWNMPDSLDVHYYDVLYANARDHVFNMANHRHIFPRSYTDTVDVNANERYIYYTVRAVDWAGNEGECSDTIAVLRPNPAPPSKAHLDSAWVDNRMIHTRWIGGGDEIIGSYNCYRRKDGTAKWDLLKTFAGDSVRANGYVMQIDDAPEGPMNQRYEYAVETVSLWDISSGLTPVFSAKLNYDKVVDVPIKLLGDFNQREGTVKLVWELSDVPSDASYYYCLYRKLNGEKSFRYLTDIPQEKRYYVDPRLAPGESAEYYVSIRFDDGRQSLRSNALSVSAPKEGESRKVQP